MDSTKHVINCHLITSYQFAAVIKIRTETKINAIFLKRYYQLHAINIVLYMIYIKLGRNEWHGNKMDKPARLTASLREIREMSN